MKLINKLYNSFIGYLFGHSYTTTITSIVEVDYDDMVFNLSVQDDETYYCNGVLVHNCRSSAVPVVKDKFDIFGDAGTRASKGAKGGQQTNAKTYYQWLERQPKFFQEEVLGKSQAQLFREGGLTNEQFRKLTSDKFGQPLTLKEIKAKDVDAWRDAGLE